jgi:hypothetical protein
VEATRKISLQRAQNCIKVFCEEFSLKDKCSYDKDNSIWRLKGIKENTDQGSALHVEETDGIIFLRFTSTDQENGIRMLAPNSANRSRV